MTTTNHDAIQVGDAMLFTERNGAEFKTAKVTKLTKHTFTITMDKEDSLTGTPVVRGPFHKAPCWNPLPGDRVPSFDMYKAPRWGSEKHYRVYFDEPSTREKLITARTEEVKRVNAKRDEQEIARLRREEELALQLEAVMNACGCHSGLPLKQMRSMETMPDNSRVYTLVIPVKPEYAERKLGWELIIVRCKDVEDMDWDSPRDENGDRKTIKKVESAYTYTNGSSYSFSSISTSKYKNDQDAVWDAIRHQYHSW